MLIITLLIIFTSAYLLTYTVVPIVITRGEALSKANAARLTLKFDAVMTDDQMKKMQLFLLLAPPVFAGAALLFAPPELRLPSVLSGLIAGFVVPRFRLAQLVAGRKRKFNDQLIDSLMIMSSSFRGGLSLIQAIEAVVDEMPEPVKQEFGIVLGENKMGVSLEESLHRLYKRMPSPGLEQMVTAILLARETGGNLALIFTRIVNTIRERKKIEQNLAALTVQGRIQAVVMTGLPVLFYLGVSASNPHFFDIMKTSPDGKKLLAISMVMWILGALSIWKISQFKDT